jgi:PAS domain S-box-containing protein
MPRPMHRGWSAAAAVAVTAIVIAFAVDRGYTEHVQAEARSQTRVAMAPYARALEGAVERRVALIVGLRSFADSRPTRASLDAEFPVFAQGSLVGTSGVVALQFVQDGRIRMTWPLVGNERALGYDLYADPRPALAADVRRAMTTGTLTVTGPVSLVQGGTGLLVRQRITPRADFPDLAAIILDVPTLVREAGITGAAPDIRLEVRDREDQWFGGDSAGSVHDAEVMRVQVPDGDWSLHAMPRGGWDAAIATPLRSARTTAAALVFALTLLGFVLGTREERLRREAALSDTRLGIALRAGRMGVFEFDPTSGRFDIGDAAASTLGAKPDERIDAQDAFLQRVHPEDRATVAQWFDDMRRGVRDEMLTEFRVQRSDGMVRWVLAIGELERDGSARPRRMLGVLSDATERRAMEERVRHAQRLEAVATLAGGVAHDFNNLLSAMVGFTELASLTARDVGDQHQRDEIVEHLHQVMLTAERAATLTGQLLAFSRQQETAATRVDVNAALKAMEPMLRQLLGNTRTYRTELTPEVPPVLCDAGQLTQVMLNLIVNARDAMPAGGSVTVRTSVLESAAATHHSVLPEGRWVRIEVRDSGAGIPPEVVSRIFEPYFTTKAQMGGTGLGLAVVYGAVTNAQGTVVVDSAIGVGTTFSVYLPVAV